MAEFKDMSAFNRFERSIRLERRYIHAEESLRFFEVFLSTAARRVESLLPTHLLWRAQKGSSREKYDSEGGEYEDDAPFPTERMKPLAGRAREGRANPKGIPFLYLATHKETAVAEVRPVRGDFVSLGQFSPSQEIKVINATTDAKILGFDPFKKPRRRTSEEIEAHVWGRISHAFSVPTDSNDDLSDYVPTQLIAELLRVEGYHGIGYASGLGEGHNVALFNTDHAVHVRSQLVRVQRVQLDVDWDLQLGYEVSSHGSAT